MGIDVAYDPDGLFSAVCRLEGLAPSRSLSSIAAELGVHRQTAAAAVFLVTSVTYREWRASRTLARACALLRASPELSIKEMAYMLGFGSTSSLDRFLARITHHSPTTLRRRLQSGRMNDANADVIHVLLGRDTRRKNPAEGKT
jgi:methylphosphotriester-DNA--protein-cysteine methyltransferase